MNQDHFRHLDAVASDTEDAHVRARSGPVFYNVPGPTKLMAHFLIDRETAVAAFRAWKRGAKYNSPSSSSKTRKKRPSCDAGRMSGDAEN